MIAFISGVVFALIVVSLLLWRTIVIVYQASSGIIERFGRYQRTLPPGLSILVPFVDRIRERVDMREQVASCLLYTSPSPRDRQKSRMPSSA